MAALDDGDGVNGGAAGGQHGVQDDDVAFVNILGQLVVILHRLQGFVVPVQADVAHLGGGHQLQHALYHAQARPQDGHKGQLPPGDDLGGGLLHGGDGFHIHQGQVPGGLVAHQRGNLADQLPEILGAGGHIPQKGELVLDERVVHDENILILLHDLFLQIGNL